MPLTAVSICCDRLINFIVIITTLVLLLLPKTIHLPSSLWWDFQSFQVSSTISDTLKPQPHINNSIKRSHSFLTSYLINPCTLDTSKIRSVRFSFAWGVFKKLPTLKVKYPVLTAKLNRDLITKTLLATVVSWNRVFNPRSYSCKSSNFTSAKGLAINSMNLVTVLL